jgi:hypothetical protein
MAQTCLHSVSDLRILAIAARYSPDHLGGYDIPLRERLKNAVSLNRVLENLVVSAAGAQAPGA